MVQLSADRRERGDKFSLRKGPWTGDLGKSPFYFFVCLLVLLLVWFWFVFLPFTFKDVFHLCKCMVIMHAEVPREARRHQLPWSSRCRQFESPDMGVGRHTL